MRLPAIAPGATIALATHNPGKLAEFAHLLAEYDIVLVSAASRGMTVAPEEDADSFAGNAELKARAVAAATGLPSLADDSGFSVASLGGAPGVYSARWAGPGGDFAHAMRRVRDEAHDRPDRAAAFICALCLAWPGQDDVAIADGRIEGEWIWPPRGDGGFGYDAMFRPEGDARSFGEMTRTEKAALSHRARAVRALAPGLFPLLTPPPRPS